MHSVRNPPCVIRSKSFRHFIVYPLLCDLKERDQLGDPGLDGRIIFRWIFRQWDVGGMDWIELAQDRDRWRALVNAVMNFRVL